ncbi:isochorismate synthase [Mobiluncus porci]|uniref:isochorismate synthase n=1 Tax=Mobiluncus porci TaxID=2652278 RepID=UPI0030B88D07
MLCVETREIDPKPLPTSGFYFHSPESTGEPLTLAGSNVNPAWSYQGNPALGKAGAAWFLVSKHAKVDDPLQHPGTGLIAFASFGFSPETPAVFEVPRFLFGRDDRGSWLTVAYQAHAPTPELAASLRAEALAWRDAAKASRQPPRTPIPVHAPKQTGRTAYEENVAAAVAAIQAGEAQKIVMARRVEYSLKGEPDPQEISSRLAELLGEKYPSCWIFSIGGLVGATPEMLLEARDNRAHARVLAGTASPGENINLLESRKNLHEHEVAVASVTEPLDALEVELQTAGPYLLNLPNLTHLATDVSLVIPPHKTLFYLLEAIHPTAAVGGLPRRAAVEFIKSHEPSRGRYAGPVGWVDARGGGQLALALRCAQVEKRSLVAWAGAGIMADSDPETEFAETEAKLAPIRDCLEID